MARSPAGRWLVGALALSAAACEAPAGLEGLWLHEEPAAGGATQLRAWDLGKDGAWRELRSTGTWPLSVAGRGTWKQVDDELIATTDDRETAWRVRSVDARTLDVEDITAAAGHRLFVRAKTCPLPRTEASWYRWEVVATPSRPNAAFDVSSGKPVAFVEGNLLEEDALRCELVRTPLILPAPVDGLARLKDGSTVLWFTVEGTLTGARVQDGVLSRAPLAAGGVQVSAARGSDDELTLGWVEPDPLGGWLFGTVRPGSGWSITRTKLSFATVTGAALVRSDDGRRFTVVAGVTSDGQRSTTVLDEVRTTTTLPGLALRPPYAVRSDGALFGVSGSTLVRVQDGVISELSQGLELTASMRSDGTLLTVRKISNSSVQVEEWFPERDKPVSTSIAWASFPGWPVWVGASSDRRLHLFGSNLLWTFRDPKALPGMK